MKYFFETIRVRPDERNIVSCQSAAFGCIQKCELAHSSFCVAVWHELDFTRLTTHKIALVWPHPKES